MSTFLRMSNFACPPITSWAENDVFSISYAPTISVNLPAIDEWGNREAELLRFRELRDNWDGMGSSAPIKQAVDLAMAFIRKFREQSPPAARATISPEGLVALEWVNKDTFTRAEFDSSNKVEWLQATPGRMTEFWTDDLPQEWVNDTTCRPQLSASGALG